MNDWRWCHLYQILACWHEAYKSKKNADKTTAFNVIDLHLLMLKYSKYRIRDD